MKQRIAVFIGLVSATGCLDVGPTSPSMEARLIGLFGGQEVGEVLTLRGVEAGTLYLPAGAEGNEYVYIPFFASEEGTARLRISVTGENVTPSRAASQARISAGFTGSAAPLPPADEERHLAQLQWQREQLDRRGRDPIWQANRTRIAGAMQAAAQALPSVGDIIPLRVSNPASQNLCANPLIRQGRVAAITERAIVVMDTRDPVIPDADLNRIGVEFDQLVWPVNLQNFGEPTDLDQNGRVIIFFTSVVNQIGAGGFFFGGDVVPRGPGSGLPPSSDPTFTCAASNQAEIFYVLVPDARTSRAQVLQAATAIVGHEFQHLINFSRRLYVNRARTGEEVWLNEGLSHIAEELLYYQVTPLDPRQNITVETIRASQASVDAFNRYGIQNIGRYSEYLDDPDEESLMAADDSLETRGATWAFLRYAADRDERADDLFFRALVNSQTSGMANLQAVLGSDPRDWMQDWTISVYTDDHVPDVGERFQQPSWNFRSIVSFLASGRFPLKVHTIGESAAVSINLKGGGSAFIEARTGGGKAAVITTSTGGTAPPDALRISVVRVR